MITVFDAFAGGGGSSTGLSQIPGVHIAYAANHWDRAIKAHAANHPDTHHDTVDLTIVQPRRYPRTDMAWFSPSCTHHSRAQGKPRSDYGPSLFDGAGESLADLMDLEADEARATMFEVVRFAEHHRYDAVLVENIPDILDWPLFPGWLGLMRDLGYQCRPLMVNSAQANHHGPAVAQSRLRWYGVFLREGISMPEWPAFDAPMPAAAPVLDSDPGRPVHGRRVPLAAATLARIDATVQRYPDAGRWIVSYYGASRVGKPAHAAPVGTLTTRDRHAVITDVDGELFYRMVNVAEQARFGGFGDDYIWPVTARETTHLIGNAVSPCAARDVAWPVVQALEDAA